MHLKTIVIVHKCKIENRSAAKQRWQVSRTAPGLQWCYCQAKVTEQPVHPDLPFSHLNFCSFQFSVTWPVFFSPWTFFFGHINFFFGHLNFCSFQPPESFFGHLKFFFWSYELFLWVTWTFFFFTHNSQLVSPKHHLCKV